MIIVCAEEIWTEIEDWDGGGEGEVITWSSEVGWWMDGEMEQGGWQSKSCRFVKNSV